MPELLEATTAKARAKSLLRDITALLADKKLPESLTSPLNRMRDSLSKTWADLAAEIEAEPKVAEGQAAAAESGTSISNEPSARELADQVDKMLAEAAEILAQNDSFAGITMRIQRAVYSYYQELDSESGGYGGYPYVVDAYPDAAICSYGNALWRFDYTMAEDGSIELGEPEKVIVGYVPAPAPIADPAQESVAVDIEGDIVSLVEAKAASTDGSIMVKIIEDGWGTSGYYSTDVLKRDGPKVFKAGTHMLWDHPTPTEEAERPEGSLHNLAGVLVSDAEWQESGSDGRGLYAKAKVFEQYSEALKDLGPHIGISIRASGLKVLGEAEGREGPIVKRISAGRGVDFVTKAGAGGKVSQLFEAARDHLLNHEEVVAELSEGQSKEAEVTPEELTSLREAMTQQANDLKEARAEVSRMRESMVLREAGDFVREELAGYSNLHQMTRDRLVRDLIPQAPIKEGAIDREAFRTLIKEAAAIEVEYLAKTTGIGDGKIREMGGKAPSEEPNEDDANKMLEGAFARMGWTERGAKIAASGR